MVRNPEDCDGEKCNWSNIALDRKSSSPTTRVDNDKQKNIFFKRLMAKKWVSNTLMAGYCTDSNNKNNQEIFQFRSVAQPILKTALKMRGLVLNCLPAMYNFLRFVGKWNDL